MRHRQLAAADPFAVDEQLDVRRHAFTFRGYQPSTREWLPKSDFDELARTVPNADLVMQKVKLRGIVTKPLDDIDDYEAALGNTGIPPVRAAEFAPAVLEALQATGHDRERYILARALN